MVVFVAGIEPATHCLEGNCSTDELYRFLAATILYSLQVSIVCPPWAHYAIMERGVGIEPTMFLFAETNLSITYSSS
jgi:glutathionyl-hydroquinone reductase